MTPRTKLEFFFKPLIVVDDSKAKITTNEYFMKVVLQDGTLFISRTKYERYVDVKS